ncbi:HD-GYP domain-containing protein [Paenibacillus bovis]|uniref:HD family phosphohydrolase n=1 Tax=Paenibacillus bovis TaxID=1616788 RepID=A0A172ZD59_9BACL|nr:HD-GYP domain-containing protein [Paenibacillus bovis]ANF95090.1 HD family phosphohydrolase [Paenibacillus bovis]
MSTLTINELKPGMKLNNDVFTARGNLLLPKGKVLMPRDLKILHAFMIDEIQNGIASTTAAPTTEMPLAESGIPAASRSALRIKFEKCYTEMVQATKQAFQSILAEELPIYKLRNQMEELLSYSREYNVLTFTPAYMKKEEYVYHNAVLTSLTSYRIAQWMNLPAKEWMQVAFAGLFHDIGNSKVDPDILHKPSQLTAQEHEEIQRHTLYGYELLKNVKGITDGVRIAALQHHEKVDGTGYPLRLHNSKIHVYARIVAVADIFHAMTLSKYYRQAQSPYLVLEQLDSEAFGKLDPMIVTTFVHKVTQFHNGTRVRLSNGMVGRIIFSDRDHPTRPLIAVGETIYNLMENRKLHIQAVIPG